MSTEALAIQTMFLETHLRGELVMSGCVGVHGESVSTENLGISRATGMAFKWLLTSVPYFGTLCYNGFDVTHDEIAELVADKLGCAASELDVGIDFGPSLEDDLRRFLGDPANDMAKVVKYLDRTTITLTVRNYAWDDDDLFFVDCRRRQLRRLVSGRQQRGIRVLSLEVLSTGLKLPAPVEVLRGLHFLVLHRRDSLPVAAFFLSSI